jgi:hypothetical protein
MGADTGKDIKDANRGNLYHVKVGRPKCITWQYLTHVDIVSL